MNASVQPAPDAGVSPGRRYSRFVGLMKFVLPLFALMLSVLLVAWPDANGGGGFRLSLADLQRGSDTELGVTRARFAGTDKHDRPFLVTAERAVQRSARFEIFDLDTLQADFTLDSGIWVSLTASAGVYDRAEGRLLLAGPIDVHSDAGYELHAGDATVDLRERTFATDFPVEGHGPLGEIRADGLRVLSDGALAFQRVRVVLLPPAGG